MAGRFGEDWIRYRCDRVGDRLSKQISQAFYHDCEQS